MIRMLRRLPNLLGNTALLALALLSLASASMAEETRIASWNLLRLGQNEKDLNAVAQVAAAFDLLAVEEVMTEDGAQALEAALDIETGADWELLLSHAVGRGTYKEMYAFLWGEDRVHFVDGALVYIDDRDAFAPEPFSARFGTRDGQRFVMGAVHVIYGDDVAERQVEAGALASYRDWPKQSFREDPVIVAGDFNLPPSGSAWAPLAAHAWAMIQGHATTLGEAKGRFASLYDNLWVEAGVPLPVSAAGAVEYPALLGVSHVEACERISDHAPVWLAFNPATPQVTLAPWAPEGATALPSPAPAEPVPVAASASNGHVRAGVGKRNSHIYHLDGCPGFGAVSAANRVPFPSPAAGEAEGYRLARNCQ